MRRFAILLAAVAGLALLPARAEAQRYFSPFAGYDYGDSAGNCPSFFDDCSERRKGYGLVVGGLSGGILGFEQDFSWAPDFFGESAELEENSVFTAMSNLVVGIPIGPLRPYTSVGIGLMKAKAAFTADSFADFSNTSFGYDYGIGLMVLLPAHLGIRVDFRRFRSTEGVSVLGLDLTDTKLKFSRASIGLVLH